MSKQFKIDAQKTAEKYQNDKSFCIHTTMDNNGSFYISNRNTNNIIRDSSLGTMRIKRTNSLQDMIMVTESKSKYLSRSGSKKVLKNINHLKKEIEGYSSPKKEIKLFTDSTNNSFFKKKNFFGMTSHLLNQQNKNDFSGRGSELGAKNQTRQHTSTRKTNHRQSAIRGVGGKNVPTQRTQPLRPYQRGQHRTH